MRPLHADLTTAQRTSPARPFVQVQAKDQSGSLQRFHYTRHYTGAEASNFHDVAFSPTQAALVRIRIDTANDLFVESILQATAASAFGWSWVNLGATQATTPCAIASNGAAELVVCWVVQATTTIKFRVSSDDGQTWAPSANATVLASNPTFMSLAHNGTDYCLFYSIAGTVWRIKRIGGGWGVPAAWTNTADLITGLTAAWYLDWQVVATGNLVGGANHIWHFILGDGFALGVDIWGSLNIVEVASSGANLTFFRPFIDRPDVLRLTFVEQFIGAITYTRNAYSRQPLSSGFGAFYWQEPAPFATLSTFGWAMTSDPSTTGAASVATGRVWLTSPSGVWSAPLLQPTVDLTTDVTRIRIDQAHHSGRLTLELAPPPGAVPALTGWPPPIITIGAQIQVSPGYHTASGPRTSFGMAFWVESFRTVYQHGAARTVIESTGAGDPRPGWTPRRQFQWSGGSNVGNIIAELLARAGLSLLAVSSSSNFVNLYPNFTVQPGEDGRSAVRRLLDMVEDLLIIEGETAYGVNPLSTDPAVIDFAYRSPPRPEPVEGHPIIEAEYATAALAANHQAVSGATSYTEAFDAPAAEYAGVRFNVTIDKNLSTNALATARAAAEQRHQALGQSLGRITTPAHAGAQQWDVVAITDPRAGLTAALRRIASLRLDYDASRALYRTTFDLTNP